MKFQNKQKNVKDNGKQKFKTDNKINKKKFGKSIKNVNGENINQAIKRGDIVVDKKEAKQLNNNKQTGDKTKFNKKSPQKPTANNVNTKSNVKGQSQSPNSPNKKQKLQKFAGTSKLPKENVNNKQNNKSEGKKTNGTEKKAAQNVTPIKNITEEPSNKELKRKQADMTNAQQKKTKVENKMSDAQKNTEGKQVTSKKKSLASSDSKNKDIAASKPQTEVEALSNSKEGSSGTRKTKKKRNNIKVHYLELKTKSMDGNEDSIKELEQKVAYFMTRPPSKTNKRRLRTLIQILNLVKKGSKSELVTLKLEKKPVTKQGNNKAKINKKSVTTAVSKKGKVLKQELPGTNGNKPEVKNVKVKKGNQSNNVSDNEEQVQSNEEKNEETSEIETQGNKDNQKVVASPNVKKGKKVRYILFVGNIPYDVDTKTLKEHFAKVANVQDVRITLDKDNKPRGFAYVELVTSTDYEVSTKYNIEIK